MTDPRLDGSADPVPQEARSDRALGAGMLVFGALATIMHMQMLTVNALAAGYAQMFTQYQLGDYERPDGLTTLSWAGVSGQVLLYALFLYWSLIRWRRGRKFIWVPLIGAACAMLFSLLIITIGFGMHPQLLAIQASQ